MKVIPTTHRRYDHLQGVFRGDRDQNRKLEDQRCVTLGVGGGGL